MSKARKILGLVNESEGWGVKWQEYGTGRAAIVTKQKFFPTEEARKKFVDTIEEKRPNFKSITGYSDDE